MKKNTIFIILLAAAIVGFWVLNQRHSSGPSLNETLVQPVDNRNNESTVDAEPVTPAEIEEFEGASAILAVDEPDIESFKPKELYDRYLPRSETGELDATYVVIRVFDECRRVASPDYVQTMRSSSLPSEVAEDGLASYERCRTLLSEIDIEATYDDLYLKLHEAQYPIITVRRREIPIDDRKAALELAILTRYPEGFMYEVPYVEASVFHRQYPDRLNPMMQEAWTILYCEAILKCNSREYAAEIQSTKYREYEYTEIMTNVASIKRAIERGDPDGLGF